MTGFEFAQTQETMLGKYIVLAIDACKHGIPNYDDLPMDQKFELAEKAVRMLFK